MDPNQQNQPGPGDDLVIDQYGDDSGKVDIDDIQGKIFIGGLSWQTTEANLRYYFEKFGELSDVALMIDKRSGKPRGFGFIKMKDPAAADIVMSNEHTIDGRLVDVKRALPRDKAPGPSRSESCKIFVGGLASEVTEKEFGDYFSKFGIVKDAVVMVDRNTGSSRGFGFVTFEKEDSVETVMKLDHEIMGKYVETKRAEPRDSRGSGFDGGYGQHNMGGGYGGGMMGGPMGGYGGGGYGGRGGRGGYGGGGPGQYGPGPGRGGYGGDRGGGMGGPGQGYGGGGGYGNPGFRGGGGGGGAYGGGGRFPAGYGGAAGGYRPGAYGGMGQGMPAPNGAAPYGYPTAGGMSPQGGAGMGYYPGAGMAAVPGAYGGYGAAAAPAGGVQPGYGVAPAGYGANVGGGGRPQGGDGDYGNPGAMQGGAGGAPKGYDNSALAGYASAAALSQQMRTQQPQQQQQYYTTAGAGMQQQQQGYGAPAYGGYPTNGNQGMGAGGDESPHANGRGPVPDGGMGGYGQPPQQQDMQGGGPQGQGQYGAYRGQSAVQGRVDRSYRPY